ncbi:MAG: flagellar motor switch protein FliN [Hyphomicrobium sp.]
MASEFETELLKQDSSELPDQLANAIDASVRGMRSMDLEPIADEQVGAVPVESPAGGTEVSDILMDLPVTMKVVLGSAKMALASVAKLTKGAVIKLDKKVGEPVDIFVNGRLIAQGEVVVLDQEANRFGVMLTKVGGSVSGGKRAI